MGISWAAALRLYGKNKGAFVVPKKGTADYDAVKKLMSETEMSPEHEVKRRQKKAKGGDAKTGQAEMTLAAGTAPPTKVEVPPPATKPIDQEQKATRRKPKVKDAEAVPEKQEKKKVQRTGKTKGADTQEFLTDMNTGTGGALAPAFAGQKDAIKKKLADNKKTTKIVTVGEGEEKTLDGMKTDDPKAISGDKPFSFQALRNKLLC